MRFLLVQLSDIHIRSNSDPVLERAQQISKAILGMHYQIDACILVLSGDVAFSGSSMEYDIAYTFVHSIIKDLRNGLGTSALIECIAIPGNHDCDLSSSQVARQMIINSLDRQQQAIDNRVVEICSEVRKIFFDFRDTIEVVEGPKSLAWERKLSIAGGRIVFRCYNTSWLSQNPEVPGKLFFPIGMANWGTSDDDVSISLLHHTYNWFDPNNARQLRTHVERTSDIILTGHEHVHTRRTQFVGTGEINQYIEGGVLQESGEPLRSSYNVLLIDTATKQQKFINYLWDGEIYQPTGPEPAWETYQVNRLRESNRFALNDKFLGYLEDAGVRLEHPTKGVLGLTDIFVYPDLREISERPREASQAVIRSEELFDPSREHNFSILGAEQSGKTSLAKILFSEYHKRSHIPLFIDGAKFQLKRMDRLTDQLVEVFSEQYSVDSIEYYRQLDSKERIVIIDNFHALRFRRKEEENFLGVLEKFAGKLVFLSNDLAQQVNKIVEGGIIFERRLKYRQFRILPFGHVRRNALVEQWYLHDQNLSQDQEALEKKVITVERVMDMVIGKNFVPAYPFFLLAMLQGLEGTTPFNTNAGTYGYFYELLIRNSLAHGSDKVQLDIKLGYLAYFAYEVYKSGNYTISSSELRSIHERYQARYSFKLNFEVSRQELVKYAILHQAEDSFNFKYKYIYYYFVASYLKDHITEESIRDEIVKISSQLENEDSANIMLFLAHLSKDPFIVNQMLDKATRQYSEFEPARLDDDIEFLCADEHPLNSKYIESDVTSVRRERLEQLDRLSFDENEKDAESDINTDEQSEELAKTTQLMTQLSTALRTMQILGQLLKNFVGTMEGTQKTRIAKECYTLGLRVLSSIFCLLKSNQTELIDNIIQIIKEEHPDLSYVNSNSLRARVFSTWQKH